MNFADAVVNQEARTTNGMKALKGTANACVDLFFKVGAMRGQDVVPTFVAAFAENKELALRIAQWARDARGGAGEREAFRNIMRYLERHNPTDAANILWNVPEIGRWDDVLCFNYNPSLKEQAFSMIKNALMTGDGLCAKWMPRKGGIAAELRKFLGMTPKQYRKTLVNLTNVVESQMCAKQWDDIEFGKVPSLAHARYKKAFNRNAAAKYSEYANALVKGEAKVNAGAVFPHDVLKANGLYDSTEEKVLEAQWNALENFVGDAKILPMVDVSGSMTTPAGNNESLTCMDVAVSLGLYLADKNTGKFKDTFLTFSRQPELMRLKGSITQKLSQMVRSHWGMSTNIIGAFDEILQVAKSGRVPQEEMPEVLLILSDMQFNACAEFDDSAMEAVKRRFQRAGYDAPKIVFWNLNAGKNVPVAFNESGAALVSGFSPSVMKSILSSIDDLTPEKVMLQTVMNPRYDI